jgi:hypothetical protein
MQTRLAESDEICQTQSASSSLDGWPSHPNIRAVESVRLCSEMPFLAPNRATEIAGIRVILVHTISDSAKHFYEKHGFKPRP